jgi:MFS family permease
MGPVTHDDGLTADRRRRERRRSRLAVLGVAMFVGGPVVGTALAVLGVVLGIREDVRWVLLVVGGLGFGLAVAVMGLRLLLKIEAARAAEDDPGLPA